VKALAEAKSRLFPERARSDVEALSLAMMGDLIACLQRRPGIARVVVVTPDSAVAGAAQAQGAQAAPAPRAGLNPAIEAASAAVAGPGDGRPRRARRRRRGRPARGRAAARRRAARGVALAPSRDGGTSALLRRPPT
jgi:2-phospho-L-lactate guanylyltransferase (CobY/MobA/RfbA family)